MARQFNLSGTQVFSLTPGESFMLVSLGAKQVYSIQNEGPATITLDWDAPPAPATLALEVGRSIDLQVSRLGVRIPQPSPSGSYAVGWYQFLG